MSSLGHNELIICFILLFSVVQVKEMGALVMNCSCVAADMQKIFEAYWYLAQDNATIPHTWPAHFNTPYNSQSPMQLVLNGTNATAYVSVRGAASDSCVLILSTLLYTYQWLSVRLQYLQCVSTADTAALH